MNEGKRSTALAVDMNVAGVIVQQGEMKNMAAALPATLRKTVRIEDFVRVALVDIPRNEALAKVARNNPKSIVSCLFDAARLGLPPGPLGRAYLVPFGQQCQLIIGYKGLIELARRSGQISTIYAKEVYEGDDFSVEYGTDPRIHHVPCGITDPEKATGFYAVAKLKDGGTQFEHMNRAEVDKIRGRSKAGNNGPWVSDYVAMGCKTVVRKLCKMLPMSLEYEAAQALDGDRIDYLDLSVAVAPPAERAMTYDADPAPEPEVTPAVEPEQDGAGKLL